MGPWHVRGLLGRDGRHATRLRRQERHCRVAHGLDCIHELDTLGEYLQREVAMRRVEEQIEGE
jgi:hypothetical protein